MPLVRRRFESSRIWFLELPLHIRQLRGQVRQFPDPVRKFPVQDRELPDVVWGLPVLFRELREGI